MPWLAAGLPVVNVLLAGTGVVPMRIAVLAVVVVEAALLCVLVAEVAVVRSTYRAARTGGAAPGAAVLAGIEAALPRPVAFLVRSELGMAQALWWAARRRRVVRPAEMSIPYTDRIGLMLWTTVGLGVVEVGVVHLAVPWPAVRWLLLAVSLYGLLWLVAFALSLRQRPHTVDDERLVLRFAHFREVVVPLDDVAAVSARINVEHKKNLELRSVELVLSVLGESSVHLQLRPGAVLDLAGERIPVTRVAFFADDPRRAVRELRARRVHRAPD